jgi:hypothetical protein
MQGGCLPVKRVIRIGRRLGDEEPGACFVLKSDMAQSVNGLTVNSSDARAVELIFRMRSHDCRLGVMIVEIWGKRGGVKGLVSK